MRFLPTAVSIEVWIAVSGAYWLQEVSLMGRDPKEGHQIPGSIDDKGRKQGSFLEGRESPEHTHSSGERGTDITAARVNYIDDKPVDSRPATDWGKEHRDKQDEKK